MRASPFLRNRWAHLRGLRRYDKVRDLTEHRLNGGQLTLPREVDFEEAARVVKPGNWVYLHHAASTPLDFLNALAGYCKKDNVRNVRTTSALMLGDTPFSRDPEIFDYIRPLTCFVGPQVRKATNQGRADYVPIFLNESGRLFDEKLLPVDVAFLNLSPPDENGYCTLGVNCDMSSPASRNAKIIVACFNESQPRTFGDVQVHISQIDYLVPKGAQPIVAFDPPSVTPEEDRIGTLIADNLVEDEATLQLGIGSIPDAVLSKLRSHKNLGLHTEMCSDGIIDLVERGNLNNSKKTVDPGKSVTAFAMGSKKFYNFIDGNEDFRKGCRLFGDVSVFGSVGYTNDVHVISQNSKMTSINSAIEVDLCGQVVSDSIGPSIYSGFGGQVDFVYGAGTGQDGRGKSILAITTRTDRGQSKIVPFIKEGAGVVSTRAHIRYLVTEYGIASLWGRSLLHRAHELIRVAHPDDREALEKAVFQRFGTMPRLDF